MCSARRCSPRRNAGHESVAALAVLPQVFVAMHALDELANLSILALAKLHDEQPFSGSKERATFFDQALVQRDAVGPRVEGKARFEVEQARPPFGQLSRRNERRGTDDGVDLSLEVRDGCE